eukprot:04816.XXX_8612_8755_1 [CDS] Oithona nana genome sequencing.
MIEPLSSLSTQVQVVLLNCCGLFFKYELFDRNGHSGIRYQWHQPWHL